MPAFCLRKNCLFQIVVIIHDILSLSTDLLHNNFTDYFVQCESGFIVTSYIVISHLFSLLGGQTPIHALAKAFVLDVLVDRRTEIVLFESGNGDIDISDFADNGIFGCSAGDQSNFSCPALLPAVR